MPGSDAFRRELVHQLNGMAGARWRACAGHPSGEDLKIIAHCHQLAQSATVLDPGTCAEIEALLADRGCASRVADLWRRLPDAFGVTIWPRTAGDLVTWMIHQADHDPAMSCRDRLAFLADTPRHGRADRTCRSSPPGMASMVAADVTGALAVVAPILGLWEIATGLRQWQAADFATTHPAISAAVLAVSPAPSARGTVPLQTATLSFSPRPGAPLCQVTLGLGDAVTEPGATLLVVPRSGGCDPPLVLSGLGDPAVSFALAAACVAAGLVSLKLWTGLSVKRTRDETNAERVAGPARRASH